MNQWSKKSVRLAFALSILAGVGAWAQPNQTEKAPLRGILPTGSYNLSEIETISNSNGNLGISVPLAKLPAGRGGLSAGISLVYNSKVWDASSIYRTNGDAQCSNAVHITEWSLARSDYGGWTYGTGYEVRYRVKEAHLGYESQCRPQCPATPFQFNWKYEIVFPDGSVHPLRPAGYELDENNASAGGHYSLTPQGKKMVCTAGDPTISNTTPNPAPYWLYTTDGSYARVYVTPTGTEPNGADSSLANWDMYFADGKRVINAISQQSIYDRNGNRILITKSGATTEIQDDAGRVIKLERGLTETPQGTTVSRDFDRVTQKGFGAAGPSDTSKDLIWKAIKGSMSPTGKYVPYNRGEFPNPTYFGPPRPSENLPSVPTLTQLELPTQLSTLPFLFNYDSQSGELSGVNTPSGAAATYTYNRGGFSGDLPYETLVEESAVSQKDLTYPGGNGTETWRYSISSAVATITAPDAGVTIHYKTANGLEFKTLMPDGTTVEQVWKDNPPDATTKNIINSAPNVTLIPASNPFVSVEYTTLSGTGAKVSAKLFDYDKNGNLLLSEEYAFATGPLNRRMEDSQPTGVAGGALVRRTRQKFAKAMPGSWTNCFSEFYCNGSAVRTLNAIQWRRVEGTGLGSYTEYQYDNITGAANLRKQYSWDTSTGSPLPSPLPSTEGAISLGTANASITETTYVASGSGNIDRVIDANGNQTKYLYSLNATCGVSDLYPTQITAAYNAEEARTRARTYDCYTGVLTSETDANGVTVSTASDLFGRPLAVTRGGIELTTTNYNDASRYVVTQDFLDATLKKVRVDRFDGLYRPTLSQRLLGADQASPGSNLTAGIKVERQYKWDSGGQWELVSNPYVGSAETTMGWTITKRDKLGRIVSVSYFNGAAMPPPFGASAASTGSETWVYDGSTVVETDAAGMARKKFSDAQGRLMGVLEDPSGSPAPLQYMTYYSYDALDQLATVRQAGRCANADPISAPCLGGLTRSFDYTSLGRLASAVNPESGTTIWTYKPNGEVLTKKDGRNTVTTFGYDALNRVTSKTYTSGTDTSPTDSVAFCWDGLTVTGTSCGGTRGSPFWGRLRAVGNTASRTDYLSYNVLGQIASSSQTTGAATYTFGSYSYRRTGILTGITYPSSRAINYSYDEEDRVTGANSGGTQYANAIGYTPHGAMSSWTLGGQIQVASVFNARLQATEMHAVRNSTPVLDLTYGFPLATNNGNLSSHSVKANNGLQRSQSFSYDGANRLKTVGEGAVSGGSGWNQTFAYDPYGNRAVLGGGLIQNNLQTPQVTTDTEAGVNALFPQNRWAGTGMDYDGAGNQKGGGTNRSFTFDAENRMTGGTVNGVSVAYTYDGNGRRVKKTDSYGSTVYVYAANGDLAAEYFTGTPGVTQPPTPVGTRYLLTDHLGSTRLETDAAMTDARFFDYAPFGEDLAQGVNGRGASYPTNLGVPDKVTQRFTSKERDAETGLDYFGARYMSGAQGRFTSADPKIFPNAVYDPQSWNKYGYVRNNPLRLVDPDGEDWKDIVFGASNAAKSNAVGGIGRLSGNSDFRLGQQIGDVISMAGSIVEMAAGGGAATGGGALCLSGVGCLGGAPVIAGGAVLATHGATQFGTAAANFMASSNESNGSLPDDANVVRGGSNTPETFSKGTGVTTDAAGKINGVSVNSAPGKTVGELSEGLPHGKVGATTVGAVRAAGGNVVSSPTRNNPNHCTMCGLTPQKASDIMKVIPNPAKRSNH